LPFDQVIVCRRLLDWVDAHRDGYWISALWFDYERLWRTKLLGGWLAAIHAGMQAAR